jgi:hypothetical protein
MNEKLNVMITKLKLSKYNNENFLISENTELIQRKLNDLVAEKFSICKKNLNSIQEISKKEEFNVKINEYGKIEVNSTPLQGKEKQHKFLLNNFYKCSQKFADAETLHIGKINIIHKFVDVAFTKCAYNNCEQLVINGNSEERINSCLKECFEYDINNKKASLELINDEYLKYISKVEKF